MIKGAEAKPQETLHEVEHQVKVPPSDEEGEDEEDRVTFLRFAPSPSEEIKSHESVRERPHVSSEVCLNLTRDN